MTLLTAIIQDLHCFTHRKQQKKGYITKQHIDISWLIAVNNVIHWFFIMRYNCP